MAVEYVILDMTPLGNSVSGFAHMAVPGGINDADVPWTDAVRDSVIRDSESGTTVSQLPANMIPAGRQVQLDNGSKYEWYFSVVFPAPGAAMTDAEKLAAVEAYLVDEEPNVIAGMAKRLALWGHTGSAS